MIGFYDGQKNWAGWRCPGIWLATSALLLLSPEAFAQHNVPSLEEKCINDHAEVVGKSDRGSIQSLCKKASNEKVDMMVVTVENLDEYKGTLPSLFNLDRMVGELFDNWFTGYEEKGNAVMLFVAMQERQFRILVGDQYDDKQRKKAAKIIHETLAPAFRRRKPSQGIAQVFDRLFREVVAPHIIAQKRADQKLLQQQPTPEP